MNAHPGHPTRVAPRALRLRLPASLRQAVASAYQPAGRWAYHFASGKLGGDPVFAGLLQRGLIPSHADLLDLGCGQGLWAMLLSTLDGQVPDARMVAPRRSPADPPVCRPDDQRIGQPTAWSADWPRDWAPPPRKVHVTGIELHRPDVERLRVAMASRGCPTEIVQADLRTCVLPAADVVILQDVLHYLEPGAQQQLLTRVRAAMRPGGHLLLRVGHASSGLRYAFSRCIDRLVCLVRSGSWPRLHGRALADWILLLEGMGWVVEALPMDQGTPFANTLIIARVAMPSSAAPPLGTGCTADAAPQGGS